MGYEIAGGLGVKMADPSRDVYVMVGDGSYLMMAQEIVTSMQEGYKLIIVLLDSQGYASIGGLSRSIGSEGFGTQYRYRNAVRGALDGGLLPVDLAANAESLGAIVHRVTTRASLTTRWPPPAPPTARRSIYVPVDPLRRRARLRIVVGRAVAEVSEQDSVKTRAPRGKPDASASATSCERQQKLATKPQRHEEEEKEEADDLMRANARRYRELRSADLLSIVLFLSVHSTLS